ncbi:conserved membrane hypothetical protein [Roseovarius sp. EC-HK134]|uniref:EamA-like transporter family protein n=1 Tax=Roseovarius mucosus TaxID=215743 RepID=A0A1V0RMW0_9RHOB|nr:MULTISPECIES: DMT family transporter [Roseovarius]ARE83061.1 EamA-like transporter family protein [Roseovarius mucosus]AWZ20299.1 Permease of the drug/metabolite transporter (DMT) superfamily [Roseovarius sp. AK1035]EDM29906.1 hypothetical protein RTM1035_01075 [Roseovarius sp. TM1035]VVT05299.1 conserved membrane hypothetical protein [Roseovarius sp. EC-SD190]VVT05532.1 conserved membrane hypothetical protein [Roseovarius sp. EC-HK134]
MTDAISHPVPSRSVAVAAMLCSAACWGGATVMTKGALDAFDPFILLVIQLVASVAALWTAVLLSSTSLLAFRPMVRAGSTGVLEPGLAYAVGVPGLALTTAGNASVIAALEPVFIFLGAWLLFRTRPTLRAIVAIVTAVIGVTLVSLTDPAGLGGGSVLGDGLVLFGTALAAAYVLASSKLAVTMPAVLLTALQQTAGLGLVVILSAFALFAGWQSLPASVTLPALGLAILSGLIQYALAFWLYIVGLKGIAPGLAGMFLTTTPIFGVFGGIVFLGERLVLSQLLGMTLVIVSLVALLRSRGG